MAQARKRGTLDECAAVVAVAWVRRVRCCCGTEACVGCVGCVVMMMVVVVMVGGGGGVKEMVRDGGWCVTRCIPEIVRLDVWSLWLVVIYLL